MPNLLYIGSFAFRLADSLSICHTRDHSFRTVVRWHVIKSHNFCNENLNCPFWKSCICASEDVFLKAENWSKSVLSNFFPPKDFFWQFRNLTWKNVLRSSDTTFSKWTIQIFITKIVRFYYMPAKNCPKTVVPDITNWQEICKAESKTAYVQRLGI